VILSTNKGGQIHFSVI